MTDQPPMPMPSFGLDAASRFMVAAGLVVDEVSGTRVRGRRTGDVRA